MTAVPPRACGADKLRDDDSFTDHIFPPGCYVCSARHISPKASFAAHELNRTDLNKLIQAFIVYAQSSASRHFDLLRTDWLQTPQSRSYITTPVHAM